MSSQAPLRKAGRSRQAGVKLIQKTGSNLVLASGVTITMLFGMVLALSLASVLILNSPDPVVGLSIALPITLIFNIAAFFLSPYLMDLTQNWLYHTRWVSLAEIESLSPETAKVIQKVCQQKKLLAAVQCRNSGLSGGFCDRHCAVCCKSDDDGCLSFNRFGRGNFAQDFGDVPELRTSRTFGCFNLNVWPLCQYECEVNLRNCMAN